MGYYDQAEGKEPPMPKIPRMPQHSRNGADVIISYIWPVWLWIAVQFSWNMFVMVPFHGNFHSRVGDWIYGRDCNYGWCDGNLAVLIWAIACGCLFIGNAIHRAGRAMTMIQGKHAKR